MESFFSRYKNALVLIMVLFLQLAVLAVQAKRPVAEGADRPSVSLMRYAVVTVITPPERIVRATGHWFRSVWFGYIDLIHVRRENTNLRQEVERLRLEQASIAQDADQGRRLQHMLGFSEHYIYKTQPAQVIGTGGADQSQVLYIDKGSKDGLQQDMPVITPDGIVGKLKDVFPHTSQVLLVTDPTSGVGAILENTRVRGVLKGRAYGQLQITVSPDSRIKAGEPIVTSGGDQIFPRGLPVGTVERVIPDPERDPDVDVLVHPAAGLSQLEEVLVVTDMSDAISPQESKDLAESQAEGEAAMKRASDVLSEKLPSRIDPNAPADTNPEELVDASGNAARKLPPPKPEHPDGFSPNSEPNAAQMVPGQRSVPVKNGIEDVPPGSRPHPVQAAPVASGAGATRTGQTGAAATSVTPKPLPALSEKPAAPAKTTTPVPTKAQPGAPIQPRTLPKPEPVGTESVGANGIGDLPQTQTIEDGPIGRSTRKPSANPDPIPGTERQALPDIPDNSPAPASPQWRLP